MDVAFKLKRVFWKSKSFAWKILNSGQSPVHNTPYYSIDELGVEGRCKEDFESRFVGLEPICNPTICSGASLLDLGCAEGLIAKEFYKNGASVIHGFDIQQISVDGASKVFKEIPANSAFRQADLSDWASFANNNQDILLKNYDIVLFLGIYHQINLYCGKEAAEQTLKKALEICKGYFAIRTDLNILPEGIFENSGFVEIATEHTLASDKTARFGPLQIYQYKPN